MDIQKSFNKFLNGSGKNKGRKPNERYASFDFCYNYFYSFYKKDETHKLANKNNIQTSCLQIGFYLASWGMMRGSSFLLEKSIRNFSKLITTISKMDPKLWEIDLNNYNDKNISHLLECKQQIINSLGKENNPTDTLITKIMLGIFANIPAYDNYFKKFLKKNNYSQTFNASSLKQLQNFYKKNKKDFDTFKIHTFNFLTGKKTKISYTKAKLIDMHGFINGQQ